MSIQTDTLVAILKPYGLTDDEAAIYLHLLRKSASTALSISRQMKIGRTRVYRILDSLVKKRLVNEKVGARGLQFEAAAPQSLESLAAERELEARAIKTALPSIVTQLEKLVPNTSKRSKVLYYEGVEGLKQVAYNASHAKDTLRVFEVSHLSEFLDNDFAESMRRKYVENKIMTYDLTNRKSFPEFTDVREMVEKYNEIRHVDPIKLRIQFETLIYNDVYATYTYTDDEIFIVEIYNDQLAAMQKQLFDFIWAQATPLKFTSKRGAARII